MTTETFLPGPLPRTVKTQAGRVQPVPMGWILVPPGDAALTRRVKAAGNHLLVQEKVGRRLFSRGLWADGTTVDRIRGELLVERSTEAYCKRRAADAKRRDAVQADYVADFGNAVMAFLAFPERHGELARKLADAVTAHAAPVGSGTVARTERIPLARRAEAAVIAWMRHQTTAYDAMKIPRVRGKRREIRRMLAERSREILARYRTGGTIPRECPLRSVFGPEDRVRPA